MRDRRKQEVIALRSWINIGKNHDFIVKCSGCEETHSLTSVQSLFVCDSCKLDLRSSPSKAHRFVVWKQALVPVFPWSDPVKVVSKKATSKKPKSKRKSFDD